LKPWIGAAYALYQMSPPARGRGLKLRWRHV